MFKEYGQRIVLKFVAEIDTKKKAKFRRSNEEGGDGDKATEKQFQRMFKELQHRHKAHRRPQMHPKEPLPKNPHKKPYISQPLPLPEINQSQCTTLSQKQALRIDRPLGKRHIEVAHADGLGHLREDMILTFMVD